MRPLIYAYLAILITGCTPEANDDQFRFIVNADPQMGEQDSKNRGIRELNALLENFVSDVNAMRPAPEFVLFNGDLVAFPRPDSFANFTRLVEPLTLPVKLVHGNHDGRFPDTQFLDAQEKLQGERALQYSFDVGAWHFVAIPAPEMTPRPEQRQDLMDWLAADLAENAQRPTMVFMHYHLLPVGLSQLEYYTLEMNFKRQLLDVLAAPGNVRYVISGHVHSGVKASIKSAWRYRGINFVIAPSPVWPRAFGDEFPEFLEAGNGEDMGYYLEVEIDGDKATLFGRKISDKIRRRFPEQFREFTTEIDPRALSTLVEAPAAEGIVNGDFEEGLTGWLGPYRYRSANPRGFVRTARAALGSNGKAAFLRVRPKTTAWTHDESEEIYQLVKWKSSERPLLALDYKVPASGYTPSGGGYVRVTGFSGDQRVLTELFHWGAREEHVRHLPLIFDYVATGNEISIADFHRRARDGNVLSWRLPEVVGWRPLQVNVADLYENAGKQPRQWSTLNVDRLTVAVGVWCGPKPESGGAVWVDNVSLTPATNGPSILGLREATISERARRAPYGAHFLDWVGQ